MLLVDALAAASVWLDWTFTALGTAGLAWWLVRSVRERAAPPSVHREPSRRTEWIVLAGVLVVAAFFRLVGLADGLTPAYWDAAVNTLLVQKIIDGPGLAAQMRTLRLPFQGLSYFDQEAVLLPVADGLQRLLGPSLELQGVIGAVFSLAGIVLAWRFGRAVRGPVFGLACAAVLATSPVQVLWSRLGGTYLGATPHILAVLLFGFQAGRRNSVVHAIVAGVLTWLSLYNHYQARVCLPLVYVAVFAGVGSRERSWRTTFLQAAVVTLVMAGAYAMLNNGSLRATFWPNTGGEVGNQGEATLAEVIERNWTASQLRLVECLKILFTSYRAPVRPDPGWGWGFERGGMLLAPTIVLGVLGIVTSLRSLRRDLAPLALTALGLVIAVLSEAQARKLIPCDLGWQLVAAIGLTEIVRSRPVARFSSRTRTALGVALYLLVSTWSFAMLTVTTARAGSFATPFRQFALPLFGDLFDSPRTFPVAKRWEGWMRDGYVVLWVNVDVAATNFATYGGIAALAANHPGRFQSFHPLDSSSCVPPPQLADRRGTVPLRQLLTETADERAARGVVWWFERPTLWDEWLIATLGRAGARIERWPSGGSANEPPAAIVVVDDLSPTGPHRALAALDLDTDAPNEICLEIGPLASVPTPSPFLNALLALDTSPPAWLFASHVGVHSGEQTLPMPRPIAMSATPQGDVRVLDQVGTDRKLQGRPGDWQVEITAKGPRAAAGRLIGPGCAAWAAGAWWVVDPFSGRVTSTEPTEWLPPGHWMGVAAEGSDRLLLAGADQRIAVIDAARHEVEHVFPAHVWPAFKLFDWAGCAAIDVVDGAIASFDTASGGLALYDRTTGRELGRFPLNELTGHAFRKGVVASRVIDHQLAVAHVLSPGVTTLPLHVEPARPDCAGVHRTDGHRD